MKILQLLIIVSLGTAFLIGMTSLLSITRINDIARDLSQNETPKIMTLYQMEILLEQAAKDIFDFSRLEQAPQKQEFQANTNDFKMNADELRRLANTAAEEDSKELTVLLDDNLTKQFSYFKDLGERLISLQENQSEKILQRRALLNEKLDPIIDDRLQKVLSPSDPHYAQKQQALLEMEINMHELFSASSGYIVKSDSSLKDRINDSIADFQYWLERFLDLNGFYDGTNNNSSSNNSTGSIPMTATPAADTHRSLSIGKIMTVMGEDTTTTAAADRDNTPTTPIAIAPATREEQRLIPTAAIAAAPVIATADAPPSLQQLQQIQSGGEAVQYAIVINQEFDTVSKLSQDIIELEDTEQNQLAEFTRAETEIRDLLDNEIKSIILQKIQALEDSANGMVTMALVSIVIAIMLAVTLGVIISSYIARPIKRLRQAVNEVEAGNFDAQFVGINDGGRERRRRGEDDNTPSKSNKKSTNGFASEELIDLSQSFNSMTEKLKANDRMQREFLGIASHELRSPIQPILSYADLAIKGDVPYEQAMEKILTHALRLQNLANDILDVARIEAGHLNCVMRGVSVNRVVKDAVDSIKDNLRKEIHLEVQLLEQDVEIKLDHGRIAQVLANILGNAAKFTKKGRIKIETSRASDNSSLIEIRISDTGGGIPEEILPRLFEKFATKDVGGSAKQGTGLGLYINKAIIKAHNGKISAFNNQEGGATFIISLPIEQQR
jgi:signal transduction histidine kinase